MIADLIADLSCNIAFAVRVVDPKDFFPVYNKQAVSMLRRSDLKRLVIEDLPAVWRSDMKT